MKTWVKVLLGIAGVIAVAIAGAFYFTSGVAKTGEDFFAAVGSEDMDRAYGMLSNAFREATSETELATYLAANRMDRVSDTSWSSRSVNNSRGSLVGTLTTTDGGDKPMASMPFQVIRRTLNLSGGRRVMRPFIPIPARANLAPSTRVNIL